MAIIDTKQLAADKRELELGINILVTEFRDKYPDIELDLHSIKTTVEAFAGKINSWRSEIILHF